MRRGTLAGILLALSGAAASAAPAAFGQSLMAEEASYGVLGLVTLGATVALLRRSARLRDAAFLERPSLLRGWGISPGQGPAKRVKIRIRCAR